MASTDLEKIQDSPHLIDILIQMEDVLDSLDIYVFKNWSRGIIAEGPVIRRYWLDFTLRYDFDKMPDPKAALRLLKHGLRVDFWKGKLQNGEYVDYKDAPADSDQSNDLPEGGSLNDVDESQTEITQDKDLVWLVRISIPRRLIQQMSAEENMFYEEEVDTEDVEAAEDSGIDDESAYMSDESGQEGGQMPPNQFGGQNEQVPPGQGQPR